jgi:hypothetical protein
LRMQLARMAPSRLSMFGSFVSAFLF